jgi:ribosome-associated protein
MTRPKEIRIGDGAIVIPAEALQWHFVRSSGPGGQHVNRTSSKAVLRFAARHTPHLPDAVRRRLVQREQARLTVHGDIVITSQRHREQPKNIADCLAKLTAIIERASIPPNVRKRTKKPRSAVAKRLDGKRIRADTKRLRSRPQEG